MQFRTIVRIEPFRDRIAHGDEILSLGSCFADNMAQRLRRAKFRVTASPTGILFNPESIARAVDSFHRAAQEDVAISQYALQYADGRYFAYDFHSSFSAAHPDAALNAMRRAVNDGAEALRRAAVVIITFGTAWIYRLRETGETVANCHKRPQALFSRELLSAEDITARYSALMHGPLRGKRIVLTVSPVRHLGDGLEQNSLSKAVLRVAAATLAERFPQAAYFPSFEIMNDELRDYRFYADDMTHPSAVAVEYIWRRFAETALSDDARRLAEAAEKIADAVEHRPFDPAGEAYKEFCRKTIRRAEALERECPAMDFGSEKRRLAAYLK